MGKLGDVEAKGQGPGDKLWRKQFGEVRRPVFSLGQLGKVDADVELDAAVILHNSDHFYEGCHKAGAGNGKHFESLWQRKGVEPV